MPTKTISQVFQEFLDEQKTRIKPRTFAKYDEIISLYQSYLESYWPGHDQEYDRITGQGGTYCDTFGPEDILSGYGEFLDYFMPRKVMCGKDTMRAAGVLPQIESEFLCARVGTTLTGDSDVEFVQSFQRH